MTATVAAPAAARFRAAAWAVPPLVLLTVAALHVGLRSSADLTPWKGGGFGMFSTIDSPGTRLVRAEIRTDVGVVEVAVPPAWAALADQARAAPSPARLTRLATGLAGELWAAPRLGVSPEPSGGAEPTGGAGDARAELLDEVALRALAAVAPVDTVRPVDPSTFDPSRQRRVEVEAVRVSVWRLTAGDDASVIRPALVRRVTVPGASDNAGVTG